MLVTEPPDVCTVLVYWFMTGWPLILKPVVGWTLILKPVIGWTLILKPVISWMLSP